MPKGQVDISKEKKDGGREKKDNFSRNREVVTSWVYPTNSVYNLVDECGVGEKVK